MEKDGNYAELNLYFGLCPSTGIGEFSFRGMEPEELKGHCKERYPQLIVYIREVIDSAASDNEFRWLHLKYGYPSFVKNEKEARKIIKFALENIHDSKEKIKIVDQIHGQLRFFRKLKFEGWTYDAQQQLLDKLKKSGYVPRNEEVERIKKNKWYYDRLPGKLEKDLAKVDLDKPWKEHLKFFQPLIISI